MTLRLWESKGWTTTTNQQLRVITTTTRAQHEKFNSLDFWHGDTLHEFSMKGLRSRILSLCAKYMINTRERVSYIFSWEDIFSLKRIELEVKGLYYSKEKGTRHGSDPMITNLTLHYNVRRWGEGWRPLDMTQFLRVTRKRSTLTRHIVDKWWETCVLDWKGWRRWPLISIDISTRSKHTLTTEQNLENRLTESHSQQKLYNNNKTKPKTAPPQVKKYIYI